MYGVLSVAWFIFEKKVVDRLISFFLRTGSRIRFIFHDHLRACQASKLALGIDRSIRSAHLSMVSVRSRSLDPKAEAEAAVELSIQV